MNAVHDLKLVLSGAAIILMQLLSVQTWSLQQAQQLSHQHPVHISPHQKHSLHITCHLLGSRSMSHSLISRLRLLQSRTLKLRLNRQSSRLFLDSWSIKASSVLRLLHKGVPPAAAVGSMPPVPPAAPVPSMSPVLPATPVSLESPKFPVYTTPPVPPVISDTHPGSVSASSTESESSLLYWCLPCVARVVSVLYPLLL